MNKLYNKSIDNKLYILYNLYMVNNLYQVSIITVKKERGRGNRRKQREERISRVDEQNRKQEEAARFDRQQDREKPLE